MGYASKIWSFPIPLCGVGSTPKMVSNVPTVQIQYLWLQRLEHTDREYEKLSGGLAPPLSVKVGLNP